MIRRANRFHGHRSVSRVKGSVVHTQHLTLRVAKNRHKDYRAAVVVSKKVASSAVVRNRIRRRLFEQIRTQGRLNGSPLDVVIYVKTTDVAQLPAPVIETEVGALTKKALASLR